MRIVTHPGTGTQTVVSILTDLSANVKIVESAAAAVNAKFDAVILLGGADITPIWYGQPRTYTEHMDKDRDIIEWTLARRALTDRLPIFGICRGCQLLAAATGGSLWQDIYLEAGSRSHPGTHRLTNVLSPLADHLPTTTVNSLHHQAIRTVPFGFDIAARSHDGLTEAIWRPGYLGVQWHPELLYAYDRRWVSLFKWFVEGLHA